MDYKSVDDAQVRLTAAGYIPSREIATVVFLASATQKPILVEGPAGVGKTELAKAVARSLRASLAASAPEHPSASELLQSAAQARAPKTPHHVRTSFRTSSGVGW